MEDSIPREDKKRPRGNTNPAPTNLARVLMVWGALGSTLVPSRSRARQNSVAPTAGHFTTDQLAALLSTWGRLGLDLPGILSVVDWRAANRMVGAMREWGEVQKKRYQSLLERSEAHLAPFGEPLRVDFGRHGWLEREREESYTAWLAWIVDELKEPDLLFRLFGISNDAAAVAAHGAVLSPPDREVWILENTRRLDLVIRFKGAVLIVVEVKVIGADSAQTAKQEDYFDWLKEEPEPFKFPVLVATEASEGKYSGFAFVSWTNVCVELRRLVPRYVSSRPIVAAMILAFVSAVERNLLELSLPDRTAPALTWMAQSEVFDHIEASLEGESQ